MSAARIPRDNGRCSWPARSARATRATRRCSPRSRARSGDRARSPPRAIRDGDRAPSTASTPSARDDVPRVGARDRPRRRGGVRRRHDLQGAASRVRARRRSSLLRRAAALAPALTRRCASRWRWSASAPRRSRAAAARRLTRAIVRAADLLILRDEESADAPGRGRRADADPRRRRRRVDAVRRRRPGAPRPVGPERVVVALSHLAGGRDARRAASPPALAPVRGRRRSPCGSSRGSARRRRRRSAAARRRAAAPPALSSPPPPADLDAARDGMRGRAARARACASTRWSPPRRPACRSLAVAHEPKLDGLARRLDQPAVAADAPPADAGRRGARAPLDGRARRAPPRCARERARRRGRRSGCCACCSRAAAPKRPPTSTAWPCDRRSGLDDRRTPTDRGRGARAAAAPAAAAR